MSNQFGYTFGILLTSLLVMSVALPMAAAQPPEKPHVFYGKVTVDGQAMPAGSTVTARVDGTVVAEDTVNEQGYYKLVVNNPSDYDMVYFYVRGISTETVHIVESGADPTKLNLSIADEGAPSITISSPADGALLDASSVTVEGTITDDVSFYDEITATVAGEEVSLSSDGSFSAEVSLETGSNEITVSAEDFLGNSDSKTVTVTSDTESPSLEVTAPSLIAEKTATIEGTVTDEVASAEELSVTLNGSSVDLDSEGNFSEEVSLVTGSNSFTIAAEDLVGNSSERSVTIVSDTTGPQVNITSPVSGKVVKTDTMTIKATVSDDVASYNEITVTLNGESIALKSDGSFSQEVSLESGQNEISVEAVDKAGNSREKTVTVLSDTKAPQIEVSAPSLVGKKTATIEGTVTDEVASAEELSVTLNGSSVDLDSEGNFSEEVSLVTGSNSFTIAAEDLVGNSSERSVTIVSDTTGPQVNITSPVSGKVVKTDTMTIKATVSDDVASYNEITVTLDGETVSLSSDGTFEKEVSISSGQNTIEVTAEDPVGNPGSAGVTVTRDATDPTITITKPEEGISTTKDTIEVSGTVEDDIASYDEITLTVKGNTVTVQSDDTFSTTVSLEEGTNSITVVATDGVGNQNQKSRTVERTSPTPWGLYILVIVVIVIVIAGLAIWRRRVRVSRGGM